VQSIKLVVKFFLAIFTTICAVLLQKQAQDSIDRRSMGSGGQSIDPLPPLFPVRGQRILLLSSWRGGLTPL